MMANPNADNWVASGEAGAADEERTCQIATHLSTWNEILCYVGLEVRLTSGTSGQFSVVKFAGRIPLFGSRIESQIELLKQQAATIIYWLVKTHHCLSTLSLLPTLLDSQAEIVCNALLEGKFVKNLVLMSTNRAASEKLSAAISGLPWLEYLELAMDTCPEDVPAALSQLLRTTTSLSTLKIAGLRMKGKHVKAFFTALRKNNTLRELSLQDFAMRDVDCQVAFARYLHKSTTLTSLTVEARGRIVKGCLKSVLRGLRDNTSVVSLTLIGFAFDECSARHAAILLSENKTLRAFRIKDSSRMTEEGAPNIFECWLPAVIGNETLEELQLPLRYWQPEKWDEIFTVLPYKETLKKVFVEIDLEYPGLQRVCLALGESEADEKVTLKVRHPPASLDLLEFMEYSELCVDGSCYENNAALTLNRLLWVDSITKVQMSIQRGDLALSRALAYYVARTTVLRSLYIQVHDFSEWKSRNMDDRDLEGLADVVRLSRNVTSVLVSGDISAFVQRLAVGIRDNYTLLCITFYDRVYPEVAKDWFAVRDTANRNCDLVTRAALFASGRRDDRYHVAALERVYKHRALLEELADVLQIHEADVAVEARKWLTCIEGLQGFMRYAGVVKERVDFHPSPEGSAQLDALNEDCWRLVRRYLMLDDVKQPSESPVQHYDGSNLS
ncbi:hypothetical protein MTO96_029228 [Rhipicephalus appendiculatus]